MTEELQTEKITTMECDIKEIKKDVKDMPDLIVKKVNESVDMKIKLAIKDMEMKLSETEKKYQAMLIGLLLGMLTEAVGLVIAFIKG